MANVPITLAVALYDRMQALYTGEVKPEGIDLTFRVEDFPRKLFDSAMAQQHFDVCEMSSSDYITRISNGDCPFVALPVFPSKMFRHGQIAINKRSHTHARHCATPAAQLKWSTRTIAASKTC